MWVTVYINLKHSPAEAKWIFADIDWQYVLSKTEIFIFNYDSSDNSIAAAPSFPGLCCFPEGHGFKQWVGDASKVLMKVCM